MTWVGITIDSHHQGKIPMTKFANFRTQRRIIMKLTKEEARWLDDKWNDFYYYFQVEDMFEKIRKFLKILEKNYRGKTMKTHKRNQTCWTTRFQKKLKRSS